METQIAIETSVIIKASAKIDGEQSLVTSVDGSFLHLKIRDFMRRGIENSLPHPVSTLTVNRRQVLL